jgi:signal transduction histidine kinase
MAAKHYSRIFLAIGAAIWVLVGLPNILFMVSLTSRPDGPPLIWLAPFFAFAGAFFLFCSNGTLPRQKQFLLIYLEIASAVLMAALHGSEIVGLLLTPIAAQVALLMGMRRAATFVLVQTVLLRLALWPSMAQPAEWLFTPADLAFEAMAVGVIHFLRQEARAREALRRMNEELLATQAMLAAAATAAERLRISRELHDAWGHDLTALGLQLEYAVNVPGGPDRGSVAEARDLARALLGKVRDVVGALRVDRGPDIGAALRALAASTPQLKVHLEVPEVAPALSSGETIQTLIRSAQEIITNTLRHAKATNLWLALRVDQEGLWLEGRDDGQGTDRLNLGHGLTGLKERFDALGGHVAFESGSGAGFRVTGWLPSARGFQ